MVRRRHFVVPCLVGDGIRIAHFQHDLLFVVEVGLRVLNQLLQDVFLCRRVCFAVHGGVQLIDVFDDLFVLCIQRRIVDGVELFQVI